MAYIPRLRSPLITSTISLLLLTNPKRLLHALFLRHLALPRPLHKSIHRRLKRRTLRNPTLRPSLLPLLLRLLAAERVGGVEDVGSDTVEDFLALGKLLSEMCVEADELAGAEGAVDAGHGVLGDGVVSRW